MRTSYRALRALEDVHKSLNEFSKIDTVAKNNALNAEIKTARHKDRNLRKRATASAGLWDRTFETYSWIWPGMDKATWHLFEWSPPKLTSR